MNKKYLISLGILIGLLNLSQAQSEVTQQMGSISFVSAKHTYVKFDNTKQIQVGDTLFVEQNSKLIPALVVTNKSSSSTVCTPLLSEKMEVGTSLIARIPLPPKVEKEEIPLTPETAINPPNAPVIIPEEEQEETIIKQNKQKIRGRISAASYSSLSSYRTSHRMRYALSFKGNNLGNSKFSTDAYVTFRHTLGEWDQVKNNLGRALKVYALSASYDFSPKSRLIIGRKINPKMSSVGAIDGAQFERRFGLLTAGLVAGTRPDHTDYGFNANLLQYGAYVSLQPSKASSFGTTTLGFMEQNNNGALDRRFLYFQHSGQLAKRLHLFSSMEVDLYENINGQISNQPRLTNLYVSLSYRFSRFLRLSASFDTRNNIIYYESYKNFIDQLIEDETRQGLRFGFTLRPNSKITWGLNGGMRFQKGSDNISRNINSYVSISKMPWWDVRTTIRASILETNFLNSRIYGIRFSKALLNKKLNAELYYRNVNYLYKNSEVGTAVRQHIAGLNLSYRLSRKLSLHLFYEAMFDKRNPTFTRINARIIKRF